MLLDGGRESAETAWNACESYSEWITRNPEAEQQAAVRSAIAGGCARPLVRVVRAHVDDPAVQIAVLRCVQVTAITERARELLGSLGVIQHTLTAIRHHRDDAEVIAQALGALTALASNVTLQVSIAKAGGAHACLLAMKTHVDDVALQKQGCSLIGALAMNRENHGLLRSENAASVISAGVSAHSDDDALVAVANAANTILTHGYYRSPIRTGTHLGYDI